MGNMSHCRFTNTLEALEDCLDHMNDDDLSTPELDARKWLIRLCVQIGGDYHDED